MIDIEEVKRYWNDRPCNIRHSEKEIGTREYFDEVETKKYFVEPHIPSFADFYSWSGKKVLEIGCGIGTDTISFARAGALVTAVDVSEKSLELAKKRAEIFGLKNIEFYQANAENLQDVVPIQKYDLVYSFGVIHHTPHPENVLKAIEPYINKRSIIKIMVYHKVSWKVLWILLKYGKGAFWKLDSLIAKYSEAQTGCPITFSYTKRSVKKLMEDFHILEYRVEHIFPYSIPEYKQNTYKRVWYFRYLPVFIFHWWEKKIGWHLCVTARLYS